MLLPALFIFLPLKLRNIRSSILHGKQFLSNAFKALFYITFYPWAWRKTNKQKPHTTRPQNHPTQETKDTNKKLLHTVIVPFPPLSKGQAKAVETRKVTRDGLSDFTGILKNWFMKQKHTQFSRYWTAGNSEDKCFAFRENVNKYLHINQKSTETWFKKKKINFSGILITEKRETPCLWWRLIVSIVLLQHEPLMSVSSLHSFCRVPTDTRGLQGQVSHTSFSCS